MTHHIKQVPIPLEITLRYKCQMPVTVPISQRGRNKKLEDRCHCNAKLFIDNVPYCLRHAQVKALQLLIQDSVIAGNS